MPEDLPNKFCETTDDLREKFKRFREKVCNGRLVKFHSDNGTLKANIVTSIHHCIKDFPAIGWVRGDSVSVLENFNAELLQSVQKFQSAQEAIGCEIAEQKKMTEEKLQQLEEKVDNIPRAGIHVEDNEAGGQTVIIDGGNARDFDEYVQGKVKKYVDGRIASDDEVNEMLQPIIDNLQINQNEAGTGYPASGTRNVCACIGNRVCPFGNYNTAVFAKRIEKAIFPNDLHFKIALTGCANDCIKARMHDFGIIGMTEPQYDPNRCVSCGACVKGCDKLSVDALKMENYRIVRNEEKCVGCGLCAKACPQHLIQVVPTENTIQPQCANLDKGPKTIQGCAVSCIGCRICEKYCPCKAIKVVDNHAVICQEKCIACGMCAVKCPRGVIHDKNGILSIR